MDDRESVTQLAQFSSLESLQNVDKQLATSAGAQIFSQAAA